MVAYCCVKDCKNNSRSITKVPGFKITFHTLPSNPDLKAKWLKAIGRPNWEPSCYVRICSMHFDNNVISREGHRTRIKDDACPTKFLPVNSNFEASHLEVCRICLATDVKMYSLQDGMLKSCIENINELFESIHIEGMPQFVCFECRAYLIKFNHLLEKSMKTQATLLDIFAHNEKLSMHLIKKQDRKQLNLDSSLSSCKSTHIYNYSYDCDEKCSLFIKSDVIENNVDEYIKVDDNEFELKNEFPNAPWKETSKTDTINNIESGNEELICNNINNNDSKENISVDNKIDCMSEDDNFLDDYESYVVVIEEDIKKQSCSKLKIKSTIGNDLKSKIVMTRSEVNMQEHFKVVKLSLQEQIEEWKRARVNRRLTSEVFFECEICSRVFAHIKPYKNHIVGHDPSRGKEECPVCKLRFKNELHVQSHRRRVHGNKFCCKKCPKVFSNIAVARKHHRWHSGHQYQCGWCPFGSAHESAVGAHARTAHAHAPGAHACTHCGVSCRSARGLALHLSLAHRHQLDTDVNPRYKCKFCDISFTSEGARRVHILTSRHKNSSLCDSVTLGATSNNTCDKSGAEFLSPIELTSHIETKHRNDVQKKSAGRRRGDSYPIVCEHCGETVKSRRAHYWHVQRQHPKEKHLYQPVITAVCEICGKGFQNSTKLHLHELRHGQPRVKCDHCPRLFYDKYAAAKHASVHTPARPHACRTCGRTFKLKGNLERHSRVHSSVTPYECSMCGKKFKYSYSVNLHVRTVHYKMPHPGRKKQKISKTDGHTPDTDNI